MRRCVGGKTTLGFIRFVVVVLKFVVVVLIFVAVAVTFMVVVLIFVAVVLIFVVVVLIFVAVVLIFVVVVLMCVVMVSMFVVVVLIFVAVVLIFVVVVLMCVAVVLIFVVVVLMCAVMVSMFVVVVLIFVVVVLIFCTSTPWQNGACQQFALIAKSPRLLRKKLFFCIFCDDVVTRKVEVQGFCFHNVLTIVVLAMAAAVGTEPSNFEKLLFLFSLEDALSDLPFGRAVEAVDGIGWA